MDAIYTDVTVICDALETDAFNVLVERLRGIGLSVSLADDDRSVVEGAIDLNLLHALETDPQVRYVRRGTTYEANFPPGDPRDRDGR